MRVGVRMMVEMRVRVRVKARGQTSWYNFETTIAHRCESKLHSRPFNFGNVDLWEWVGE